MWFQNVLFPNYRFILQYIFETLSSVKISRIFQYIHSKRRLHIKSIVFSTSIETMDNYRFIIWNWMSQYKVALYIYIYIYILHNGDLPFGVRPPMNSFTSVRFTARSLDMCTQLWIISKLANFIRKTLTKTTIAIIYTLRNFIRIRKVTKLQTRRVHTLNFGASSNVKYLQLRKTWSV